MSGEIIGKLQVTVTFNVDVDNLCWWDAKDLQQAARNQFLWYCDGTADVVLDMMSDTNRSYSVVVANAVTK